MSDDYQRIEVITGAARRRWWTTEEKLRIVEETLRSGGSISMLARRHGVAPNLLYRWRRLMTEGGAVAVQADDAVTGNAELRRLEERMRELERQLGRKTLEVEILKEALARSRTNRACSRRRRSGTISGEGRGRDARGVALQPGRTTGRGREAASAPSQSARRGGPAAGAPAGRCATHLRLSADHGAPEPRSRRPTTSASIG